MVAAGIRITLSAILSASCSSLSPGLFTVSFIWTAGSAVCDTGEKYPSPLELEKNGRADACGTGAEWVLEDFSAPTFIRSRSQPPFVSITVHLRSR
jgi:hypothetical protein